MSLTALLAPPWRDVVLDPGLAHDGRQVHERRIVLGPEYGPANAAAYDHAIAAYEERAGGEAFWDRQEEAMSAPAPARAPALCDARKDAEAMAAFIERKRLKHELPLGELNVYLLYWREGLGIGEVARRLGCERSTVDTWIKRLRKRLANHLADRARAAGSP